MGTVMSPINLFDYIRNTPAYLLHAGIGPRYPEVSTAIERYPDIVVHGFEPTIALYNDIKESYPGNCYHKAVGDTCSKIKFYNDSRLCHFRFFLCRKRYRARYIVMG
jgi:hypothetical protein